MYETSCNALVNSCSSSTLTSNNITFQFYFALRNSDSYEINPNTIFFRL